jgi:hypothetical protein
VRSDLAVTANFGIGTGSLIFATNNSEFVDQQGNFLATATNLNMSGTLGYGGSNSFSGGVASVVVGVNMAGTATGRFYGPAANEVGGVYSLTDGTVTNVGSFVAKR